MRWFWLALLCGCGLIHPQTREDPRAAALRSLIGQPVGQAIYWWGVPTTTQEFSGGRVYQWEAHGATHAVAGGGGWLVAGHSWQDVCKRWVMTDASDIIKHASMDGKCN